MTTIQIIRHELLMTGKLTCFMFAIQTGLQCLPLIPSWVTPWLWLLTSLLTVVGLKSDVKRYKDALNPDVKRTRLILNLLLFILSWLLTIRCFKSLRIPPFQEKDKDMAENAIPGMEIKMLSYKIFDDFGQIWGLILLCTLHFCCVGTLVSMIKVGMLLLDAALAWMGTGHLFPVEKKLKRASKKANLDKLDESGDKDGAEVKDSSKLK